MKLPEHVDEIRTLTQKAFDKLFSSLGLGANKALDLERLPPELHNKRRKLDQLIESHTGETGSYVAAREKALDELTFTLFNRIAALKVMEAHHLFPEVITKRPDHGDRSFAHKAWLEQQPDMRNAALEGIREFLKNEFNRLGEEIGLYHRNYPYALLPGVLELNEILDAVNTVEKDSAIEPDIWQSDDILGWLYESYNNAKKKALKDSGAKTEYDKVSLQSQVYTPRWVVKFLVDNSLGKLYLEMYPDSRIREKYAIANAPTERVREPKPLTEIRMIDPATGSANFLLYGFDFFFDLYMDQVEHYGASYNEHDIPRLIIEHNLHGIDLDDRAVQLAQLGLYIKAKRKRLREPIRRFNVVSSDFYLPDYEAVRHIFETPERPLSDDQKALVQEIWADLQQAYRFGSLVRVGEKVNARLEQLTTRFRKPQMDIFAEKDIVDFEVFRDNFFLALEKAVAQYARNNGESFLSSKTRDAITYLKLLTTSYDVATANPPYTDSGDFGPELKIFVEENYKKPFKFHTNLYASFIKRSLELINDEGYVGMVHPPTFMYIKTFEDVRKYILEKKHIDIFTDWGYLGMFNPSARVDSCMYILGKKGDQNSTFIRLSDLYEGKRKSAFDEIYADLIEGRKNDRIYTLPQSKLKIIESWPFIYWISDGFRRKFKENDLDDYAGIKGGLETANNIRFLRFWWEVSYLKISKNYKTDKQKWVSYSKGGPYKKWHGNLWLVINWENDAEELISTDKGVFRNREYYFLEGITYSASGSKGVSFRILPPNHVFDKGGSAIFIDNTAITFGYLLGFLNSKLTFYISSCLNPTVNIQVGDLKRIPFVFPVDKYQIIIDSLTTCNVKLRMHLNKFSIIEKEYEKSPLVFDLSLDLKKEVKFYLNYENHLLTQVLLNEAIINEKIFEVYELTPEDRAMVLAKEGESIGGLPVLPAAREAYLREDEATKEFPLDHIGDFITSLPERVFTEEEKRTITDGFPSLYQSNNDLEEFCTRHQINPINVWYWFRESNIVPEQRAHDIAMEFLADLIRELLNEDEDGIIPLVENAGEEVLYRRIERRFQEKGFITAQFSSFDSLHGCPLPEYLNRFFFKELSDHLNLFMYLPKTPFIWHLTSGEYQGFDCYLIIYKWSRDRLYTLKSRYLEQRERALVNRQTDLSGDESAKAQNEKERIRHQLREIKAFRQKIDELLAEGYDPKLDDGVGKNIAPLQQKGMLAYEVLNAGQLEKYLNADW